MKRFYNEVSIAGSEAGFGLLLDGKPVRTPQKALLQLPTRALAEAVALEWEGQGEIMQPRAMAFTRHANSVIDRIMTQRDAVITTLAGYGQHDLICYRASHPADLVARQAMAWDPLLDWAARALDAPLRATAGIDRLSQDETALVALHKAVAAHNDWELAGLHDLVTIAGSLVIALAVSRGQLGVQAAWQAGQLDELFQAERWGEDSIAAAARADRLAAFETAARWLTLVRTEIVNPAG